MKLKCTFASTRPVQTATTRTASVSPAEKDFASTRPVQIATRKKRSSRNGKITLPPHAPCRLQHLAIIASQVASTLPPHAPCRLQRLAIIASQVASTLPPHAPCRLQPPPSKAPLTQQNFASTRPVQIATKISMYCRDITGLCLHTPRADCNGTTEEER